VADPSARKFIPDPRSCKCNIATGNFTCASAPTPPPATDPVSISRASFANASYSGYLPSLAAVCTSIADTDICESTGGQEGWGLIDFHIKTNVHESDDMMYHIVIEGYSYDQSKAIHSEAVGYMYSNSTQQPINSQIINGNGNGAGSHLFYDGVIHEQYVSADKYLVLRMTAGHYCVSFTVTAQITYGARPFQFVMDIYAAVVNSTERL
jgi:hypothetical protein